MKDILRITTVQADLHWENPAANLAMFAEKLNDLPGKTDLVVLPEMFTTGFSMNPGRLAEGMNGPTMLWLHAQAARLDAIVTGSFIATDNGKFFNRLIWMQPDGTFDNYDKRHLFTLAGEQKEYTAGKRRLTVEWRGWKICPLICYDLRFPVWSRNTEDFDLLIYTANWPERRNHHWKALLTARAIENQAYVAGINRIGDDGSNLHHSGDTCLIDFSGKLLYQATETEAVFTAKLSRQALLDYRKNLPFLDDRDFFEIKS